MEKQLLAYQAELLSLYARIEGMKAENMNRQHRGESIAYTDGEFFKIQGTVDYIATQIQHL